jgi:hypothetical protein
MHYSLLDWLLLLLFDPEDGGNTFLRNVANIDQITRRHIPEDSHRCENVKSCKRRIA